MSTILKALKQAEKEFHDRENENRRSFHIRTVLNPRMLHKQDNFLNMGRGVIPLAGGIVLALFFGTLFFINKTPQPSFIDKQTQVLDTEPVIVKNPKQISAQSAAEAFDLPKHPNERGATPESVHQTAVSEAVSHTVKEKNRTSLDPHSFKKLKKNSVSKPKMKQEIISGENTPFIGEKPTLNQSKKKELVEDAKEEFTAPPPEQMILPLENERLKVQAISWNKSQANRIAVIDNHVLREGDFVQGYRLVTIEKDTVILHYSGNDYRVGFKHR